MVALFLNSDYNIQRKSTLHLGNEFAMWTGMSLLMSILSVLPPCKDRGLLGELGARGDGGQIEVGRGVSPHCKE
jgi:hypothetical protein